MLPISLPALINWLIASLIAAISIMLAEEIIEHNLELIHSLIMALLANLAPTLLLEYFPFYFGIIPFSSLATSLLCWILLALIFLRDAEFWDRIKIAILGFAVSQILMFFLPYLEGLVWSLI